MPLRVPLGINFSMRDTRNLRFVKASGPVVFGEAPVDAPERQSEVNVVFTTWQGTQAALKTAGQWAQYLEARVVVWFLEVVPRQFALRRPPASVEFAERRLSDMAMKYCDGVNVEIRLCLCTDFRQCLVSSLEAESVVILGGRTRWWRTWEKNLSDFLKLQGHVVLFVDTREERRTELLVLDRTSA